MSRRFPDWLRLGTSLTAGLALALAFPLPGWDSLAWIAPGLWMLSAAGTSPAEAFRLGFLGGWLHWLVGIRWLLHIPHPPGAIAGWIALTAYCGLYQGMWNACVSLLLSQTHSRASTLRGIIDSVPSQWSARAGASLILASLWIVLEWVRSHLLTGFPWNPIGVTQYQRIPLIQLASVAGVYGVSFLVVWLSTSLGMGIVQWMRQPGSRWGAVAEIRIPVFLLIVVTGLGLRTALKPTTANASVRLALVQPSIPQTLIWSGDETNRYEQLLGLSKAALASRPQVLVWPEGSLPDLPAEQLQRMGNPLKDAASQWIFGTDDTGEMDGQPVPYNSAFHWTPDSGLASRYHKRYLVPFGELIPMERWLPFMRYLTPIGGSFGRGSGSGSFVISSNGPVVSPMICFEDTFPHHTRTATSADTDLILELTNDGWFGESSAQWQHAANVTFRAVENRVRIVRCSNNGLTLWIDEFGTWRELFRDSAGGVYGAGFTVVDVPYQSGAKPAIRSPYHTHGDLFVMATGLFAAISLARAGFRTKRGITTT